MLKTKEIKCNFCKNIAGYDGKTIFGTAWVYMCEHCFKNLGIGLGLGRGQKLKN